MRILRSFSVLSIAFLLLIFFACQTEVIEEEKPLQPDYNQMVSVPAIINFSMGYTDVAEPVHTIPLISAFKIGKYEITYDRWYIVRIWAATHGYTFANLGREGNDGTIGAAPTSSKNEPVTSIIWRDAIVWCNAASQYDGFTSVYYTNAGFTTLLKISTNNASINATAGSEDNPYVNWTANGYRLPTEAEWEACARYHNGTDWTPGTYASGATADYNNYSVTGAVAWFSVNSGSVTHHVGTKNANQLGIFDMSGNVWEWCWDWNGAYTTASPYTDSNTKGPAAGSERILRSGSFYLYEVNLMISFHFSYNPYTLYPDIGLRVARTN